MKCPRCGNEMTLDSHRKIPLNMCYNCGYIEGRRVEGGEVGENNFEHLKGLNLNETAAFLAAGLRKKTGLDLSEQAIASWLDDPME